MKNKEIKECVWCGIQIISTYRHGFKRWSKRKFCSLKCFHNSYKGTHLFKEHKEKISNSKKIISNKTKEKISKSHLGEKNPAWKGGSSFLPYCQKFNIQLREKIRIRDNKTCQLCGKTEIEEGKKLSVHHIHYDKENCYPDLITLCRSCNSIVNSNRNYWEEHFMKILKYKELLN